MSDSFADLWNSTAPSSSSTSSKQQLRTLGSATPNNKTNNNGYTATKSSQYDAFSLLASSSRPSSRPLTPALRNQQQQHQPSKSPINQSSPPGQGSGGLGVGDAFSSLLDASYTFSSATGGNMSLAERQAASEKARRDMIARREEERKEQEVIWSGIDKIVSSNSAGGKGAGIGSNGDLFSLAGDVRASSATISKDIDDDHKDDDDDWGLSEFSSAPAASKSRSQLQPQPTQPTLDALDDFISSPPSQSETVMKRSAITQDEFDFDFGDREYKYSPESENDNVSEYAGDEDDNILGELGNPVSAPNPSSQSHSNQPARTTLPRSRAPSPPPHILGQIVEMGFSLEQAKTALASTKSGVDVAGALEVLFAAQEQETENNVKRDMIQQQRQQQYQEQHQERQRPPPRRSGLASPSPQPSSNNSTSSIPTLSTLSNLTTNIATNMNKESIQQHADKLIAQASGIGMSVLKNAGVFWRERVGSAGAGNNASASNSNSRAGRGTGYVEGGKPRWMVDRNGDENEDEDISIRRQKGEGASEGGGFRDDDDFDQIPQATFLDPIGPTRRGKENGVGSSDLFGDVTENAARSGNGMKTKTGDLLSTEGGEAYSYISPARRRSKAPTATTATNTNAAPPSAQINSKSTQIKPTPKPIIPIHPLSQNTLTTLHKHKSTANQKFREGAFGDAEVHYTRGINSIPTTTSSENDAEGKRKGKIEEGQLWKVVILNNRALVRLKNGDANGALEDCEDVLGILRGLIGDGEFDRMVPSSFYAIPLSSSSGVHPNDVAETVDLRQAFQKAHRRRAEALEMRERWKEAGEGWGLFVESCWWIGEKERGEARRNLERCRRMINASSKHAEGVTTGDGSSRPKQAQIRRRPPTSTAPSAAAKALHASNLALEAEDLQKHALKDTIDSRIQTWLAGKESNIRALLASLDTVLWEELRWQKVGMHELVTDKQVKIGYLKAIARVHPDKLNVNNTSLEQRMIANGVFAALNEAWINFKQ